MLTRKCDQLGFNLPKLIIEPGRSIVGRAGVAVYTVGVIKDIPTVRTYVSLDGGMGDDYMEGNDGRDFFFGGGGNDHLTPVGWDGEQLEQ